MILLAIVVIGASVIGSIAGVAAMALGGALSAIVASAASSSIFTLIVLWISARGDK